LDPFLYSPGHIWFGNQLYWGTHAREIGIQIPVMVHANGIGLEKKEEFLKNTGFWFLSNNFNCYNQ
jgi:hypothetical protein